MIRIITATAVLLMLFSAQAQACYYQPQHHAQRGDGLYQVVNEFFIDGNGPRKLQNNFDLLLTSILPNTGLSLIGANPDSQWWTAGDEIRVDALYQKSAFRPGLDLSGRAGGFGWLTGRNTTEDRYTALNHLEIHFTVSQSMADMDFDYRNHLLAFSINDADMLSLFEDRYVGADYYGEKDDVWLIAFEGFGWGRVDFTDFVAVVSRSGDHNNVPLPTSILFLAGALGSLLCFPNRRRSTTMGDS